MKPEEYENLKRGYACVDLDAIAANVNAMQDNIGSSTRMVLVIKTNGYGHGAVPIALMAEEMDNV